MKGKFLFVHDVEFENILKNPKGHMQNVSNWIRCFDWQAGDAECASWRTVTIEKCEEFEYVMLYLMTDVRRLGKFVDLVNGIKQAKTIAYLDGPLGWQFHPFLPENKQKYLEVARKADYAFCYGNPDSVSYWEYIARKPVHYIDLPWPVRNAKNYFKTTRENKILIAKGLRNINEERNVFCSLAVASNIQKELPDYSVILHTVTPIGEGADIYYREFFGLENVEEVPLKGWPEYILDVAPCKIAIHLDVLETWGQFALDCGTCAIPLISSGSVAGRKLFPKLRVDYPRNIAQATRLAFRVLEDKAFREEVVKYAWEKVEEYSFSSTLLKIEKAVGKRLR